MSYYSRVYYPADTDGDTAFAVPFQYLAPGHVHVFRKLVSEEDYYLDELVEGTDFNWTSSSQITLTSPRNNFQDILLERRSPLDGLLVQAQGVISAAGINLENLHALYLIQEATDTYTATADRVQRSTVRALVGETFDPLPSKGAQAGKVIGLDSNLQPVFLTQGGADSALRTDLGAQTGAQLVTYYQGGVGSYSRGLDARLKDVRHLFDFVNPIYHTALLSNALPAIDCGPSWAAAIADIPNQGGTLVHPACKIPIMNRMAIGSGGVGAVSTKNGQRLISDGYGASDLGSFGGAAAGHLPGTEFVYTGSIDNAGYFFSMFGPLNKVFIQGLSWDCNGLMGYGADYQSLFECYVQASYQRWRTGQGLAYILDAPLPFGFTGGMFDNDLIHHFRLPWTKANPADTGSLLRGTEGFRYLGGPLNNQGFSKNRIRAHHVFDNAATFGMKCKFIDQNQFDLWIRTSDGLSPSVNAANAGVGIDWRVPAGAPAIGENTLRGTIGTGLGRQSVEFTYEGAATILDKAADTYEFFGLLDYEVVPDSPLCIVRGSNGISYGPTAGGLEKLVSRTDGNLGTGTEYICPVGSNVPGASGPGRFPKMAWMVRGGRMTTFRASLPTAPGPGCSRTFTLHVNGVATALTLTYGAGESGSKALALQTPLYILQDADLVIVATTAGAPAASSAGFVCEFQQTEKVY